MGDQIANFGKKTFKLIYLLFIYCKSDLKTIIFILSLKVQHEDYQNDQNDQITKQIDW